MALDKGMIDDGKNPLKAAMFIALGEAGISEDQTKNIIERVFHAAAGPYFEAWYKLAKQYLAMDDKALTEVESFVNNFKTSASEMNTTRNDVIRDVQAQELRIRAARGSANILDTGRFESEPRTRDTELASAMPKPEIYNLTHRA